MKTINNSRFDELFKISIYRDITRELQERHLITDREFEKISARIDAIEEDLVKPVRKPDGHGRKTVSL